MKTGSIEYAPDYKSKKKGVTISPHTGGASADIREVIETEVDFKEAFDEAVERARLESAVVAEAKECVARNGMLPETLKEVVRALLQFEQDHK